MSDKLKIAIGRIVDVINRTDADAINAQAIVLKMIKAMTGTENPLRADVCDACDKIEEAARERRQEQRVLRETKGQLVFVVDGTGSSQPFLDSLKPIILSLIMSDFIPLFETGFSITFVVYRDIEFGPAQTSQTIVFPGVGSVAGNDTSIALTKTTMDRMFMAHGGGDTAEWLNSGLAAAINGAPWSELACTKTVMVFTDACNHGSQNYRGRYSDNHPQGLNSLGQPDPQQVEIGELMGNIGSRKDCHLSLFKLHPGPTPAPADDQLEHMMTNWRSLLASSGGGWNSQSRLTSVDIPEGVTNPGSREVMTLVKRSIRGEIRRAYHSLRGWSSAEDVIIEACQTIRHRADCGGPQEAPPKAPGAGGARRNKSRRANRRRNKRRSNRY